MDRRYKDALNFRFDEVADIGFAVITSAEIMRWWDRQRFTPSIWQDLKERWEERGFTDDQGEAVPLKVGDGGADRYILAWGEEGWLVPVRDWT